MKNTAPEAREPETGPAEKAAAPGNKLFCIYGNAGEGLTSSGLGFFIVALCAAVLGLIIWLAR